MACSDCLGNTVTITTSNCTGCDEECTSTNNTDCLVYSGPDLDNLGIITNQGINDIFEALNDLTVSTVISAKVVIPSADVLQLFTTPYTIISTPGANKFIQLLSIYFAVEGTLSVAYTTAGTSLFVKSTNSANASHFADQTLLGSTNANILNQGVRSSTKDVVRVNEAVKLSAQTGNPTLGTGDLAVYLLYLVNDISL